MSFLLGSSYLGIDLLGDPGEAVPATPRFAAETAAGQPRPRQGVDVSVWLLTDDGLRLALLTDWHRLSYTRTVNDVGELQIDLPYNASSKDIMDWNDEDAWLDARIEVWRAFGQRKQLDAEAVWFIRSVTHRFDANGERMLRLGAVDAIELLARRVVISAAGNGRKRNTRADKMLVELVEESLGSGAAAGAKPDVPASYRKRDISAYVEIEDAGGFGGQAPVLDVKKVKGRNLLEVSREIAQMAEDDDTEPTILTFDMIGQPGSTRDLAFIVQTGARGVNRAPITRNGETKYPEAGVLTLSPEMGNLSDAEWTQSRADEVTVVWGQKSGKKTYELARESVKRRDHSIFNRREVAFTSSEEDDLDGESKPLLRNGRPKRFFAGTITETAGAQYGRDWSFGDRVVAQRGKQTMIVHVHSVTVTISEGRETVTAELRAEDDEL